MPLPLYRGLQAPEKSQNSMHIGLWFERFFSGYQTDFTEVDKDARSAWLKDCARTQLGDSVQLRNKALQMRLLARSQGGDARVLHSEQFVSGLGNPHPLENGFLWHPTLGLPYLPGSAVKGLVRALVETAYDGTDKAQILLRWFGTEKKGDVAEHSGEFIFLDAVPVKPCDLHVEVMTPHMGQWYAKGQKTPLAADTQPGDWHSPVPISYLVARNLSLQFAIMPRAGADSAALTDLWQALETALDWLGAGAKTALGFGQFRIDAAAEEKLASAAAKRQQALQQAARLAQETPHGLLILELEVYMAELPTGLGAGDERYTVFWRLLEQTIQALRIDGSPTDRQRLHSSIQQGMKAQQLTVSERRKKDFKALLNGLLA